tara:strand:+ start:434 stop:853 length:420 start_codon:yes stop_codon:yes gene_type:complete
MSASREAMRERILANPGSRRMDELALAILHPAAATPEMRAFRNELLRQVKAGTAAQGGPTTTTTTPLSETVPDAEAAPEPAPEPPAQVGPPLADDDRIVVHLHSLRAPNVAWEARHQHADGASVGVAKTDGNRCAARLS